MRYFIYNWLPVIGFCALIFVQSSYPSPKMLPTFTFSDKLLHVTAYAILAILFGRAFNSTGRLRKHRWVLFLLAAAAATIYGLSDEWHQSFVPGRNADAGDALADFAGGLVGSWIYLYYLSMRARSQTP